jgi:hypothetical protein
MEALGWRRRRESSPTARQGRAAARGLDARRRIQHAFMPAEDASQTSSGRSNSLDPNHGIYRDLGIPCGWL